MIKKIFKQVIYWGSMPIIAVCLPIGYYFFKKTLMPVPHPSQNQLAVSEIVYRGQELVALFWKKHQKCPMAGDIEVIRSLPLVANVKVSHVTTMSCKLTIQLKKDDLDRALAGKIVEQTFHFKKSVISDKPYQWTCYTDAAIEVVSANCRQYRNIDYYLHDSYR